MHQDNLELRKSEAIEAFHLALLRVMQTRIPFERYILKGGGNLRYFMGSHRYSRDLDFDTQNSEPWALEASVDGTLKSGALKLILEAQGLVIKEIRKPKQTETTQRWKVLIEGPALGTTEVWTKIEFSRRELGDNWATEPMTKRSILKGFAGIQAGHYLPMAAIQQKVEALAERASPKPRDVFDLSLLLTTYDQDALRVELPAQVYEEAIDRGLGIEATEYVAQVVPFLDNDVLELFGNEEAYLSMRDTVVERLMEMADRSRERQAPEGKEL